MKTVLFSTSYSPVSRSYMLALEAKKLLEQRGVEVQLIDLREHEVAFVYKDAGTLRDFLAPILEEADNVIFAFGVQNYTISDALKSLLDTSLTNVEGKFYGVLCAAGGERSYLATSLLTQICMNQWRMIQLPRVVYGVGSDFTDEGIANPDIHARLTEFTDDFCSIGKKLLS